MRIQHWLGDTCRQNFQTHTLVNIDIQLTNIAHTELKTCGGDPVSVRLTFGTTHFRHESLLARNKMAFFADQRRFVAKMWPKVFGFTQRKSLAIPHG